MFKTVLAALSGFNSDRTVLDAAVAVARVDGAHVTCLHTRIDVIAAAAAAGALTPTRRLDLHSATQAIAKEEDARSSHVRREFAEACTRHGLTANDDPEATGGVSIGLKEITTLFNEVLEHSRFHDLVVVGRDAETSGEWIQTLLMNAGRPLLLAPPKPVQAIGRHVAIAWKEGPEAARAVAAGSPLWRRAERVTIICATGEGTAGGRDRISSKNLADHLLWHGVKAEVELVNTATLSTTEAIQAAAYSRDADLLIMGAYGHSRLREMVLGGVTREILAGCAIPVLMVS